MWCLELHLWVCACAQMCVCTGITRKVAAQRNSKVGLHEQHLPEGTVITQWARHADAEGHWPQEAHNGGRCTGTGS